MATIVRFEFAQNTLSVEEGYKNGKLMLVIATDSGNKDVYPTITVSDQTVISAPASVFLTAHSSQTYSRVAVPVAGVGQGSATVTATLEDSGTTLTTTATVTVIEPTQVIVSEPSLENIADTLRDRLGVSDTYTPAQMSGAIYDIGKYDIRREAVVINNKNTLSIPRLRSYTVPDGIEVIDEYALAYAYCGANRGTGVELLDLNDVTEVKKYGLDHFSDRSGNSWCVRGITADNLVTAGDYAFRGAFRWYKGATISFPELTTVGQYAFSNAFYYISCEDSSVSGCTASFPKLTTCTTNSFDHAFWVTGGSKALVSADFSKLETAGNSAFLQAFYGNSRLTSVDFSSLKTIGTSTFSEGFYGCSSLTSLSFPELTTAGDSAFNRGLNIGSTANPATVSFPKLSTIGKNCFTYAFMWGGVRNVSFPEIVTAPEGAFSAMFYWSSSSGRFDVQKASFPKLTTVGKNAFSNTFAYQTVIATVGGTGCDVELPELTTCNDNSFNNMFLNCTSLTTLSFPKLKESAGTTSPFQYMCDGCSSLTSVTFPALDTLTQSYAFQYAFRNCTSLTSISFPALTTSSFGSSRNQFNYMLYGVTGCTLHFPAAVQANIQSMLGYPNFNGTNITVSFDL